MYWKAFAIFENSNMPKFGQLWNECQYKGKESIYVMDFSSTPFTPLAKYCWYMMLDNKHVILG